MQHHIGTDITHAAQLLQQGEIVAVPTETVYGLAANALDVNAVLRIYEAKERPQFNPLIVHIADWVEAEKYVSFIPEVAVLLAQKFCPGPLTFLLAKKEIIPDIITAGSALVAIRVPNHSLTHSLLGQIDFPIAAPSANQFGYISPTTAQHVWDSLGTKVAYILDGGASQIGVESTIIGFDEKENIVLHRQGAITIEMMQTVVENKFIEVQISEENKPQTSGQLKSHYAPNAALYIGDIMAMAVDFEEKKTATINFCKRYDLPKNVTQFILSEKEDLNEAASKLFSAMRQIDQMEFDIILTEKFPDLGLGRAINDRLGRAQSQWK